MLTMHWVMKPFVSPQCLIFCLISAAWKGRKAITRKCAAMSPNACFLAGESLSPYRLLAHDTHSLFTLCSTFLSVCCSGGQWQAPNAIHWCAHVDSLGVCGLDPWVVKPPNLLCFSNSAPAKHPYEIVKGVHVVLGEKVPLV